MSSLEETQVGVTALEDLALQAATKAIEQLRAQGPIVLPRLLTLEQAADYIQRTPAAVEQLVRRGKLPVTQLDSKRQFDRFRLDKLIEDKTFYQS